MPKTLHQFCQNEIAGFNNEGHEGVLAPAKLVPTKDHVKHNYMNAIRDGSMALLRALAVSFQYQYDYDIRDPNAYTMNEIQ